MTFGRHSGAVKGLWVSTVSKYCILEVREEPHIQTHAVNKRNPPFVMGRKVEV